ncbi:PGRS family protein [Sorangium sp. So ce1024]|uniref:PGRS family protein n=1 Tax=Sorangium sp. So ce1024 TaxID=3133327 RepID=UPI003EFE3243
MSVDGDDKNPGTPDEPVQSLSQAIALAAARTASETKNVYACAGDAQTFTEQVEVPSGVAIYGGLDCNDGWTWSTTKTKLTAREGEIPLKMSGLRGGVHVEDLHVIAQPTDDQDENGDGLSSIAAIAHRTSVELVRCILEAGDGAHGAPVPPYEGDEASAPGGMPGQKGGDACSLNDSAPVLGGSEVTNDCGTPEDINDDSTGGPGGNGGLSSGADGTEGSPAVPGNDWNSGGRRQDASNACRAGGPGDVGNDGTPVTAASGAPGKNAAGPGAISPDGYTGAPGGEGFRGAPGRGGGGGGGARGAPASLERACPGGVKNRSGAGGGSGGAGGCGGKGGRGGRPGGSSIALLSIDAELSFEEVTLIAGNGGDGSDGGFGQNGGPGGPGGTGGEAPVGSVGLNKACNGGKGGAGGTGGRGGGGQGGHSLGIAFRGTVLPADSEIEGVTIKLGQPGNGGNGGNGEVANGVALKSLEFP